MHTYEACAVLFYFITVVVISRTLSPQAYKAVVNDATIFKLELPMKQKGWVEQPVLSLYSRCGINQCYCPKLRMQDSTHYWFKTSHDVVLCLYLQPTSVGMKTQPESKCPELLANYCDMLLRKTPLSKKLTSEEIELKLKEVVRLPPVSVTFTKQRFSLV